MMAQQQSQSRSFPAGSSRVPAKSGVTGINTTISTTALPPRLTGDALTSFYRLDIPTYSILKWDRYDCSKTDAKTIKDISEDLLELRYAEHQARAAQSTNAEKKSISTICNTTLWSFEHSDGSKNGEVGTAALWIMRLNEKEQVAKAISFASSGDRKQLSTVKETLERKILKAGVTKTSGQIQLKEFFPSSASQDDPRSLSPQKEHEQLHLQFLKGVEDHLQTQWIWTQISDESGSFGSDENPANSIRVNQKKMDANKDEEMDDDEEGAINDASKQATNSDETPLRYWPGTESTAKVLTRFQRGALLQFSAPSNPALRKYADKAEHLLHIALHCSLDEYGHLYVSTRPQAIEELQGSQDCSMVSSPGIIAPDGVAVTFIEEVAGLNWPGQHRQGDDMEEEIKKSDECMMALRQMLLMRGVDVTLLDNRWILCETDQHVRFLWPSKLCFANVSQKSQGNIGNGLSMSAKPLPDLAERAKRLVKESIGIPTKQEVEDSIMMDEEENVGGTRRDAEEEVVEDVELNSEGSISEDNDNDGQQGSATIDEPRNNIIEGGETRNGLLAEVKSPLTFKDLQSGAKGSTSPSLVSKANSMSRYDDETDLWGSFGFGTEDQEGKRSMRRQSGAGLDEGGFGLITEDDFSFFDETNRGGGGVFGDMEVDLQSQDELLHTIGNENNEQPLEMDNGSDMTMTNSTFIDHPSLPGFTPGSLSATSPAVGGLNAKTPRTPFSPSQDIIDANITIEGESDSLLYNRHHFVHEHHHGQGDHADANLVDMIPYDVNKAARGDITEDEARRNEKPNWAMQNRTDLLSKYEQGKYAMVDAPESQPKGSTRAERDQRGGIDTVRNRLQNRDPRNRRLSGGSARGISANVLRRLTLSSSNVKAEDESSDVDATIDEALSDRSSLMDDESDDEELSTDGDTSEEDAMATEERLKHLESTIAWLTGGVVADKAAPKDTDRDDSDEDAKNIDLVPFLDMLMANPQIYLVFSDKLKAETIARSCTTHLFDPLPCQNRQSNLAALLSLPTVGESKLARVEETMLLPIAPLQQPKIMVGCRGQITTMESSVLPYWDTTALSPVSGPKHIVALALHCGSLLSSWQKMALDWFTSLQSTFQRSGLGSHNLVGDGLLGLGETHSTSVAQILVQTMYNTEQWTDTLESLLSRLRIDLQRGVSVVVYTINIRINAKHSWIYPRLQKDLRDLAWKRWEVAPELINIWPMAWSSLASTTQCNPAKSVNLLKMALSIYDSIQIPVRPNVNDKRHLPSIPDKPIGVRYPSFILLPSMPLGRSSTSFQLDWNAEPYNLLDCGMLLHIAYSIGKYPGQLTFVAIIDEKAQGYHMNGWRRQGDLKSEIELIWKEALGYARRARILWRVIICKEKAMELEEIQHWSLTIKQSQDASFRALDVTLACIESLTPMTIVLPRQASSETIETISSTVSTVPDGGGRLHFIRADRCDYAIYPPFRIDYGSINLENRSCILALQSSVTLSLSNRYNGAEMAVNPLTAINSTDWSPSAPHHTWLHILQIYNTRYFNPTQDLTLSSRIRLVTQSFHNLTFVAREKLMAKDNLPWHISILDTARRACHLF